MVHLRWLFGFPVRADTRFRLGDRKYILGRDGAQTLKLLARIDQQFPAPTDRFWLLPLRKEIREIDRLDRRALLTFVVQRVHDDDIRRLAIWLRGRLGGTLGTTIVAEHASSRHAPVRKEVVRALQRMDGWAELREIATTDRDHRIRRLAAQPSPSPYANRMAAFVDHVARHAASTERPPLVVARDLDFTQGKPPKPIALIRAILERIHRIVTGSARRA